MRDRNSSGESESAGNDGTTRNDRYTEGYDTDFTGGMDIHTTDLDSVEDSSSLRHLGYELKNARDVTEFVETIRRFGWTVPLAGLLLYGVFRGFFEYFTEPFAMSQRYVFTGWELALGINLVYGLFLGVLVWFLYFGVIGSLAGFFSNETKMDTTTFKIGGYLMPLFVPVLALASALAVTIQPPDVVIAGVDSAADVARTHEQVAATPEMRFIDLILAFGWIVIGFLMIPMVSVLYQVGYKESVLSVLPVTLVAVVATQLF